MSLWFIQTRFKGFICLLDNDKLDDETKIIKFTSLLKDSDFFLGELQRQKISVIKIFLVE